MSESTNKAARQRILDTTLPMFIEVRLGEVSIFDEFYMEMERRDPSPMRPQRTFEAAFKRAGIVHAIWDDAAARLGTGTMLLKGEAEFCRIYVSGNGIETVMDLRSSVGELTIRVTDEDAARQLKRLFGKGTATLRPGQVARLSYCIERPRPDGTTFRQTNHMLAVA